MLSFGDIYISAGAQTKALTSTAALLDKFSATGGANGNTDGGYTVQPDKANDRIKVLPGLYFIDAWVEFTPNAECDVTMRIRKNGTAVTGLVANAAARQDVKTFTPSLSPALIAQGTTAEQTLTVTGLLTSDKLLSVIKPTSQAGLGIAQWRISAADTLALTFANVPNAGGDITPTAAETYKVIVARFGKSTVRVCGFMNVLASDSPGTLAIFADPSVGAAGGAPTTLVPIDLTLESSANTTITVHNARLALWQMEN